MRREFGLLDETVSYRSGSFTIEPLEDCCESVQALHEAGMVSDGWIYPLLERAPAVSARNPQPPLVPHQVYALPDTHVISAPDTGAQAERTAEFLVLFLGFVKGVRLVPDGWQHFYRTPLAIGKLVDFLAWEAETQTALDLAQEFWSKHHGTGIPSTFFGALHWFLFGQCYPHAFEVFGAQCMVLDTCWRVHRELAPVGQVPHPKRIEILASCYGIELPEWARPPAPNTPSPLTMARNAYFHEAQYGGEPIGFAFPRVNLEYELTLFNSRLLLAMVGFQGQYTASRVGTRNRFRLQ